MKCKENNLHLTVKASKFSSALPVLDDLTKYHCSLGFLEKFHSYFTFVVYFVVYFFCCLTYFVY